MRIRTLTLPSLLSLVLIVSVLSCRNDDYSGPLNSFHRYEFKNSHLVYEFIGDARGREDIFMSDYGKYEARYSKYEMLTPQAIQPVATAVITRLTDAYTVEPSERKVMHTRVRELDSLYHLSGNDIPSAPSFFEQTMKKYLFRSAGTDSIGGVVATLWETRDGSAKMWIWRGILLKKLTQTKDGMLGTQLIGIDTTWTVDTSRFSLPDSGYTFTDPPVKQ